MGLEPPHSAAATLAVLQHQITKGSLRVRQSGRTMLLSVITWFFERLLLTILFFGIFVRCLFEKRS
jgi:hypothetical protein